MNHGRISQKAKVNFSLATIVFIYKVIHPLPVRGLSGETTQYLSRVMEKIPRSPGMVAGPDAGYVSFGTALLHGGRIRHE